MLLPSLTVTVGVLAFPSYVYVDALKLRVVFATLAVAIVTATLPLDEL